MRNLSTTFFLMLAVAVATAFASCIQKKDQEFLNSMKQDVMNADSALVKLTDLQVKLNTLRQLIGDAPEDIRKSMGPRYDELLMSTEEYANKAVVNLDPYRKQIDEGKGLIDGYAEGKVSLEEAKSKFVPLAGAYQNLVMMAEEFQKTYQQYDTEYKALAREALSKASPAPAKKQ